MQLYGQQQSNVAYNDAVALFMKSEIKLRQHREYISKKRLFEDPVGYDYVLFNTVRSESPELYKSTTKYKDHLLRILTDSSLKKDEYMNRDILMILFNLCIDDYVDVMEQLYNLFMKKQISFGLFERAIFQDFNMSFQVAKNYKNERLRSFWLHLQNDAELMNEFDKNNSYLNEYIQDNISGKDWEVNLKEWVSNSKDKNSPPFLKQVNCK